jgi:hypothetical protein
MTTPTPPPGTAKLGPGTLTIGATGTEIDVSCLVNNLVITMSKDKADDTRKLCGTVRPGAITYTYELDGNLDTDIGTESGLFALSQSAAGTEQAFTFTPSTEAGTTATGKLIIDPMDFGTTDDYGSDLTSDIAWSLVDKPTYAYGDTEPPLDAPAATVAA